MSLITLKNVKKEYGKNQVLFENLSLEIEKGEFVGLVGKLSLIHISEPTRRVVISYAVFCLKKIFFNDTATTEIYTRLFVGSVRCV